MLRQTVVDVARNVTHLRHVFHQHPLPLLFVDECGLRVSMFRGFMGFASALYDFTFTTPIDCTGTTGGNFAGREDDDFGQETAPAGGADESARGSRRESRESPS